MSSRRELAKCVGFDLGIEDHGILVLFGHFDFDGVCQGLGYPVDTAFLMRFLDVFGVDRLSRVNGMSCWVTRRFGGIDKIEPLHRGDGKPFVIADWQSWRKKRFSNGYPSPYECRTGDDPAGKRR